MALKTTPLMEQYRNIRRTLADDTVLFFRLGDFFEMFFDDACYASKVLEIALTKRNKIPMCGVPCQNVAPYLAKLVESGRKVAICDQVEEASASKGIVRREVTRIVTSGTILEENALASNRNNYLCAVTREQSTYGLAVLDLSTGEFWVEISDSRAQSESLLEKIDPAELIFPESLSAREDCGGLLSEQDGKLKTACADWTFEHDAAHDLLLRHFKVHSLDGFGCDDCAVGLQSAGAILHYVSRELLLNIDHIRTIKVRRSKNYMLLDQTTVANLELIPKNGKSSSQPALIRVLDNTTTPMGARLLFDWLLRPLVNVDEIEERQSAVEAFVKDRSLLKEVRSALSGVRDLERIISRIGSGSAGPRDIRTLESSLNQVPLLRQIVSHHPAPLLDAIGQSLEPQDELVKFIDSALDEELPVTLKDGGAIRDGYNCELDELRSAARRGREWLAEYQQKEKDRTGIKNLKIRYNKVFGYYIEISKANIDRAPEDYIRKQTLVNAERFITPELKDYENRIIGAHERAVALEQELFSEVRDACIEQTSPIQKTAAAVAMLDVLANLADRALHLRYARPKISGDDRLKIEAGRHPIIEQIPGSEAFVPNDTIMDQRHNQLMIITGPNMAGKSTYIRQVALIVIMAQMGSFVPAASAEIGVVDRVFTRVGASDDLARGRSTFMVEMQETANILNNATSRSLIVLDEIGRGTSTFDGISIAWAVAEHLHDIPAIKAKTLFATHYHELTDLALTMDGVKNYHILVKESGKKIAFLRKIAPGAADKSYGIHVAQLAGLPAAVIDRANEILANLEEEEINESGEPALARHRPKKKRADEKQLNLL